MGKRVLVTGLSGYIGRYCLPIFLEKGYEVVGCGRGEAPDYAADANWHQIDLLEVAATENLIHQVQPNFLLNLAWCTEHGKFWRASENLRWVEASCAMLRAFTEVGGQRFVGAGSCAEYDWRQDHFSEHDTPLAPQTPFGRSKNALYEVSSAFADVEGKTHTWRKIR